MNIHGKDIKIFTANSNPKVAHEIAQKLGLPVGKSTVSSFADGEISVSIEESVRGSDVFVVQSTCGPVNNNLMELLIMIDAFKRASAGRITAVVPYFGYARQDRKAKARDPISAKLCADLITTAGADRMLTMDLHAAQIQGFFDIPVDHLLGVPILAPYFVEKFKDYPRDDLVVVSPDLGSVTRARKFAEVYACATHGVLSGPAIERITNSCIKEMVLLDTIPEKEGAKDARITMLPVAPVFAEAIGRIYEDKPVSPLFG